jgi:dihydrofolate synthase/folylpolyglutamate synthase
MMAVKSLSSFNEVNKYLRRFYKSSGAIHDPKNMKNLMNYLGNPQDTYPVIHIAGTSGKTSTAYYTSSLLSLSGKRVGLTVSPHVDELNERVQINGHPLDEVTFCKEISSYLEVIDKAPIEPSYFEFMVSFAFWYFAKQKVDYAVVEVGLGGLNDATNVISRPDKVCVITDIGFDHVETLGNSLSSIAKHKLGIVHKKNPIFSYKQPVEVMEVIEATSNQENSQAYIIKDQAKNEDGLTNYLYRNWFLANEVYKFLAKRDGLKTLDEQHVRRSLHTLVPGRMDIKKFKGKVIVMDGAHNEQKMQAFVSSFKHLFPGKKAAVLIAMKDGKDYKAVVSILSAIASRAITTSFSAAQDLPIQSMDTKRLAKEFSALGVNVRSIVKQEAAFNALVNGSENICLITGSLYLLGQVRKKENLFKV